MTIERGLHDPAPHAAAASVDDAHLVESGSRSGLDVLGDDRGDVARRERVQIDLALDRQVDGIGVHAGDHSVFAYSAVTTVWIPPRTEKSPTTVMRRGRIAATRSSRI